MRLRLLQPRYYECHITIEPVFDSNLVVFEAMAAVEGFKVAKLLMVKDREATAARSDKDSFCTGHGATYDLLDARMCRLIVRLIEAGYKIYRWKIEAILLDHRETYGTIVTANSV